MAAALLLLHLAAAACLALVLPAAAGAGAALLVVLLGAVTAWDRALLRGRGSVRSLELRGDRAVVVLADGRRLEGRVGPRRNVSRWWVTLPLRGESRRTLVVVGDMLPAAEFRRLRLWALWGRVAREASPPMAAS
jgi:hypothetical protein